MTSPTDLPTPAAPAPARVERRLPVQQWRDSEARGRAWRDMRTDLARSSMDLGYGLVGPIIAEAYALTSDVGQPGIDVMAEPLRLPEATQTVFMRLTCPVRHLLVENPTEAPHA